jgi:hypothetical protein
MNNSWWSWREHVNISIEFATSKGRKWHESLSEGLLSWKSTHMPHENFYRHTLSINESSRAATGANKGHNTMVLLPAFNLTNCLCKSKMLNAGPPEPQKIIGSEYWNCLGEGDVCEVYDTK